MSEHTQWSRGDRIIANAEWPETSKYKEEAWLASNVRPMWPSRQPFTEEDKVKVCGPPGMEEEARFGSRKSRRREKRARSSSGAERGSNNKRQRVEKSEDVEWIEIEEFDEMDRGSAPYVPSRGDSTSTGNSASIDFRSSNALAAPTRRRIANTRSHEPALMSGAIHNANDGSSTEVGLARPRQYEQGMRLLRAEGVTKLDDVLKTSLAGTTIGAMGEGMHVGIRSMTSAIQKVLDQLQIATQTAAYGRQMILINDVENLARSISKMVNSFHRRLIRLSMGLIIHPLLSEDLESVLEQENLRIAGNVDQSLDLHGDRLPIEKEWDALEAHLAEDVVPIKRPAAAEPKKPIVADLPADVELRLQTRCSRCRSDGKVSILVRITNEEFGCPLRLPAHDTKLIESVLTARRYDREGNDLSRNGTVQPFGSNKTPRRGGQEPWDSSLGVDDFGPLAQPRSGSY